MSSKQKEEGPFVVVSRDEDGNERVETRRTDKDVALEDISIIKTICGRAAWIDGDG